MASIKGLLQSVALHLDPDIPYATLLRAKGYRTIESISRAPSAEKLSERCRLLIGDARILWNAAGGSSGGHILRNTCGNSHTVLLLQCSWVWPAHSDLFWQQHQPSSA